MSQLFAAHAGPAAAGSAPAGLPEIEYPSPLSALPDEPLPFLVKNTFVVPAHLEPSSLLGSSVFAPRAARSCPSSGCPGARGPGGGSQGEEEEAPATSSASRSTSAGASSRASSAAPPGALPQFACPAPEFTVRNTFIDTVAGRLSSMVDGALAERRARSCPSSGFGLPDAWVALSEVAARLEADAGGAEEDEFVPTPAVCSQRAEEDEDGFLPAPVAFMSRAEDEAWDSPVAPALWAPLSFMPPPPPVAPPPAALVAEAAPAPSAPATAPLGSPECPTVGSALHCQGACRPCAHAFTKGCANGVGCQFCHLCEPGELKRRQRERRIQLARQKPSEPRAEAGGSARGRRGGKRA
ncbi:unnamed protein product [Prorocentrum cordatum]|uniref:C3H1-type domain-containing protein n=1 Tax=Prorocentrum cordatum TaxID=2364126 RepID=A0ABN9TR65_9DINO|nr:unnamed protein product [Polarella glacialis]